MSTLRYYLNKHAPEQIEQGKKPSQKDTDELVLSVLAERDSLRALVSKYRLQNYILEKELERKRR